MADPAPAHSAEAGASVLATAFSKEDGVSIARCPEFPSLRAHGKTAEKAVKEIQVVVATVVRDMEKNGKTIPDPITERQFSGSFRVQLPRELQQPLVLESVEQGTSLNQLIVSRLFKAK